MLIKKEISKEFGQTRRNSLGNIGTKYQTEKELVLKRYLKIEDET
jgi:hypothetical protein